MIDLSGTSPGELVFRGTDGLVFYGNTAPPVPQVAFSHGGGDTGVLVDFTGEGVPDITLHLHGTHNLMASDFIL